MPRHDSNMQPGRMHLVPKREYTPFDDHTSTMFGKMQAMRDGIDIGRPINYVPAHVRAAKGIVIGVGIGLGMLLVIGLFAAWAWRMV
jgi:hypothetical protein